MYLRFCKNKCLGENILFYYSSSRFSTQYERQFQSLFFYFGDLDLLNPPSPSILTIAFVCYKEIVTMQSYDNMMLRTFIFILIHFLFLGITRYCRKPWSCWKRWRTRNTRTSWTNWPCRTAGRARFSWGTRSSRTYGPSRGQRRGWSPRK